MSGRQPILGKPTTLPVRIGCHGDKSRELYANERDVNDVVPQGHGDWAKAAK